MTKDQIKILLEKLSERPIVFHSVFSRVLGGVNAAIFFQQIYYWSDKGSREDGYIYKTKNDIEKETTLTTKQQDWVRRPLEKTGVLKTQLIKVNGSPTLHYKVSIENLYRRIMEYYKLSESSISDMTPEITKKEAFSSNEEKNLLPSYRGTKKKDERVLRVIEEFVSLCKKHFQKSPWVGVQEYTRIKQLMDANGMVEQNFSALFKWWFSLGKPNEETFHLRKALSNYQLNNYRIDPR